MVKFLQLQALIAADSGLPKLETTIENLKSQSSKWYEEIKNNGSTDKTLEQYATVNKQLVKATNDLAKVFIDIQRAWDDLSMLMLTRKFPDPDDEEEDGIKELDDKTISAFLKPRKLSIFISYTKNLAPEVVEIEKVFSDYGLKVIRHESMNYMDDREHFWKKVRTTSYALLFINKEFLQTPDTMHQVLQLRKDENYKNRMALLMCDDVDIGSTSKAGPYIKFWAEKSQTATKAVNESPEALGSLLKDAKHLATFKMEIEEFISSIGNLNVPPYQELKKSKFDLILKLIVRTIVDPK